MITIVHFVLVMMPIEIDRADGDVHRRASWQEREQRAVQVTLPLLRVS
jgi:hypothetical protein